jgi:hypothetical protein
MAALDEGSFSEVCLIEVGIPSTSGIQFASKIEEFDPAEGTKDITSAALVNGGRVHKRVPEEDYEITAKLYEVELGSAQSLAQYFTSTSGGTGVQQTAINNTRTRQRVRVTFLWTDDTAASTAVGSVSTGNAARRIAFSNAYITEYKEAWEDKTLVLNVKFKGAPFQLDGTTNILRQSVTAAGTGLPALSSFV